MFFGKKKIIGLDIGTSTIKLAELDVSKRSATLVSFGMLETPPNSVSGGEVIDSGAIGATIGQLVEDVNSKRKLAATSLWGTSVIVKRISIPRMEESLIAEQIRWEAEQYIPYDVNEVNLAFQVLKQANKSPETMDILLVAAVQEKAFKSAETIELAGLKCAILDVAGFALANCFFRSYGDRATGNALLLNVGATTTNFVVVSKGEVVFCRDIPVGGSTYTSELQKGMGINSEEAEVMKMSVASGQPAPDEAAAIIQSVHDIVADEISGSVDFFVNTSDADQIKQCFVTGGGSKMPGLLTRLSNIMNCEKFDPFLGINYSKKVFSASYIDQIRDFSAVAIGLGLRGVGDS
ncbi:MAG: type IV pilus assembly protein PilM [Pseudobdellovibrionaceae bacterium]|nr:type IV pilus assembly protein PilM [Bdellovibrionales bacterium]USN47449.1 MAG: type IV pilus assembly protein PilM [Pseudobdellovibrionaceae bacterium]